MPPHLQTSSREKLYWTGNIAKSRVIRELLAELQLRKKLLVLDYGCGAGGDWPSILSESPGLELIGYEPHAPSLATARRRLEGLPARLLTGGELEEAKFQADFVVSFSEFEHVYDRRRFLRTAREHLAPGGVFYLNYDDGHFRNVLDLTSPGLWIGQAREWLHNLIAGPLTWIGITARYQSRVTPSEADALIAAAGFEVFRVEYANLASFKMLAKAVPPERSQDFSWFWLEVEETLNRQFRIEGETFLGDPVVLWRQMATRTLWLRHTP